MFFGLFRSQTPQKKTKDARRAEYGINFARSKNFNSVYKNKCLKSKTTFIRSCTHKWLLHNFYSQNRMAVLYGIIDTEYSLAAIALLSSVNKIIKSTKNQQRNDMRSAR